ncbi:MAG: hypothetical protein KDD84_24260, partial [Caldilineaceae bacterium]|nr:hypothetical protein [Caldilineaceae bacterium]
VTGAPETDYLRNERREVTPCTDVMGYFLCCSSINNCVRRLAPGCRCAWAGDDARSRGIAL